MPYVIFPATVLGNCGGDNSGATGPIADAVLTDTCDLLRKGPKTAGVQGSQTAVYSVFALAVACRLGSERTSREVVQAGVTVALTTWTIDLPLGTDLRPADRVLKGGITYEVVDTNLGQTAALFTTATLIRVNR